MLQLCSVSAVGFQIILGRAHPTASTSALGGAQPCTARVSLCVSASSQLPYTPQRSPRGHVSP